MMLFMMVAFALSLLSLVGVFLIKNREERTGSVYAPRLRAYLDVRALQLRDLGVALLADLEKVPPEVVHLTRIFVHQCALASARLARGLERASHRLADMVSHKGRFVRREPRSEFLKRMTEHKNGNTNENTDV